MANWDRGYRQKIVDEYLNATGRNHFLPAEFLDWLQPQIGHRAWEVFFGKDDAEAAREYRIGLARQFVSGLRIKVVVQDAVESTKTVTVRMPAFISPVSDRSNGGGYVAVDTNDDATMQELARQAAADLARWIERYKGTATLLKIDITGVSAVAGQLAAEGIVNENEAAA